MDAQAMHRMHKDAHTMHTLNTGSVRS